MFISRTIAGDDGDAVGESFEAPVMFGCVEQEGLVGGFG
jgi:hypothetical protein